MAPNRLYIRNKREVLLVLTQTMSTVLRFSILSASEPSTALSSSHWLLPAVNTEIAAVARMSVHVACPHQRSRHSQMTSVRPLSVKTASDPYL